LRKPAAILVSRLPITQARVNLGQVAKRAHVGGEYFILEKDGIPVIGIMDAGELEDYLELRDPQDQPADRTEQCRYQGRASSAGGRISGWRKATPHDSR
jgi:hypothetical protein